MPRARRPGDLHPACAQRPFRYLAAGNQLSAEAENQRHAGRHAGAEIVAALAPLPGDVVIKKHRYDAFHNTQLETVLRNIRGAGRVDTVIIIGTVTSICCESTARSAFMRDYKVAFISDANGGLDEASHNATLDIIGKVFGRVMTVAELGNLLRS
ncbi:cysteine hydrolase [Mesorhizobium sp. C264A]